MNAGREITPAASTGRERSARRKLFDLHSWLGFNLALFMLLVVFTGTFAVIANEIDWLVEPKLRASSGVAVADWDRLEAAVREAAPGHTLGALGLGEEPYLAHRATMLDENGRRYFLLIDPVSLTANGAIGTLTVQRFFRDLHRYLFMPSIIGLPLVTTMAVVLLISLYTGLKTVRNWRTVATRVRFSKGARVALGDFHKAAGLWSIWFFVLIIATSFWYFAELVAYIVDDGFEPQRPGPTLEQRASYAPVSPTAGAGELVRAAQAALPGLEARQIYFSLRLDQASTVLGRKDDPLVRHRANRVFLDPVSAEVIRVQRSPELSWPAYLNEIADPLHFGSFGGLLTKLIWFVFGLTMLSLTLTGVWLTWRRLKSRAPTTAQYAFLPLLLVVTAAGVPYVQRHLDDRVSPHRLPLATAEAAGMTLTPALVTNAAGAISGAVEIDVASRAGRPNIADVEVVLQDGAGATLATTQTRPAFLGQRLPLRAALPVAELRGAMALELRLNFGTDATPPIVARFPLRLPVADAGR
ncbi:MAG: PepSY-associated TM helix domain-containing protein [Pseudomonadota bacterium]